MNKFSDLMNQNFMRNNMTGQTYDFGPSQPMIANAPQRDYSQVPVDIAGVGTGYRVKGDPYSLVLADGRKVTFDFRSQEDKLKDLQIAQAEANVRKTNADIQDKQNQNPFASNVQQNGQGLSGDELLKTVPPQIATQVKALATGRMAFPGGFALKSPYWQQMIGLVSQYDPTFDAVDYNKRNRTATAFSAGTQGNAVRAANQALSHMGQLETAITDLDNFNGAATPLNYIVNPVESWLGDPRQGIFTQKAQAISSELRKVFAATGGGGLTELQQWEKTLPLNASKEQQQAYLKSGVDLLNGALGALNNQYQAGIGPKAQITDLLSPESRKILGRLGGSEEATANQNPNSDLVNQIPTDRKPVRTGTHNGKKVVQYSDGSIEYAN